MEPRREEPAGRGRRSGAGAARVRLPLAEVAARVRAAPPRCGATRLVCIDGPSGSGKTTLAGALAVALAATVLPLDAVYPGWDGLVAGVALVRDRVVGALAAGRPARVPRWDWERGRRGPELYLGAPPVLLVEGAGAGARAIAAAAVLLVWVEAPENERHRRAMARDGQAYRPHWERWAAQERAHFAVERTRERADLLVDGTAPAVTLPAPTAARRCCGRGPAPGR